MKTIYLTALAIFFFGISKAQFFQSTTYKGAFGAAGTYDWTTGWTNWDPENQNYPLTNVTVSSDITSNTTWTSGTVVLLENKVYVTNNATLTIEPGVIIRGDKATEGTLIITKGSKIMAEGISSNPIIFTSNFDVADGRSPGDWGGLIILGNAVNNQGSAVVEGGLDPVKASYGGLNDADNSGILKYVRIEFAGFPFQPDKEINGLTLGSVGSGTTLEFVQVSFCNDDSFEFFGGTVNAKGLIAYRGIDDNFDTDFGYRGNLQYLLAIRDPNLADQCTCSTSEGFESDNDGSGTTATPQTAAVFSNVTEIGPYRGSTSSPIDSKFKRALRIRKNSSISIFNSIFTDWPTGLHIDGSASETNASSNNLIFKNNILAGMGTDLQVNTGSTFDINTFFNSNANSSIAQTSGVMFVNPHPTTFLGADYRLQGSSPAATGADFSNPKLGTVSINEITNELTKSFLWPNPVINSTTLSVISQRVIDGALVIYDITGKIVESISIELETGENKIMIDAAKYSAGIYSVAIITPQGNEVIKMVVTK